MTLTDAGPLIAIIDADEPDHSSCMYGLDQLILPLVTTWPAFTEAMYCSPAPAPSELNKPSGAWCRLTDSSSQTSRRPLSTGALG